MTQGSDTQSIALSDATARGDVAAVDRHRINNAGATKVGLNLVASELIKYDSSNSQTSIWSKDEDSGDKSVVPTWEGRDATGVKDNADHGISTDHVEIAPRASLDHQATADYLERIRKSWEAAQAASIEFERRRAKRNEPSERLMAKIALEMKARATRSVAVIIKLRARQFMRCPLELDSIACGLSDASPQCLIVTAKRILADEMAQPRRFMGFGGEIPALNAKAVVLTGRYQRRLDTRQLQLIAAE